MLPFGLSAAVSAKPIQKTNHGSGTAALIISNEKMKDIINIVKSLQD